MAAPRSARTRSLGSGSTLVEATRTADNADQGTIVVVAQMREYLLVDVPPYVQAFTRMEPVAIDVRDLRGVIQLVPGVAEGRGNAAGARSCQIRGVSLMGASPGLRRYCGAQWFSGGTQENW